MFQLPEEVLITRLPFPQHHKLHITVLQNARHRRRNQIQPLVGGKAGDDGKQRHVTPHGQTERRLQRLFVIRLFTDTAPVVAHGQGFVLPRVVIHVINAVENPGEFAAVVSQHRVEPLAVFRRADFLGVPGADRGHPVRRDDGGFHQVDAPVIVHAVILLVPQRKHIAENPEMVLPLILDIMNGEYRADILIPRSSPEQAVEVHHRERRLPVMRVQDVGVEPHLIQRFQRRHAEVGKPLPVIKTAVERIPLEIVFVINKIICDARAGK